MTSSDANGDFLKSRQSLNMIFFREGLAILRFGLVGALATTVHIVTVWLLLTRFAINPIWANTLAFLTAFWFSFAGNYLWTFRSLGNLRRAIFRFFVIAVSAFVANSLLLAFLVNKGWFSPVVSAVFSSSITPIVSFLASRFWAFK